MINRKTILLIMIFFPYISYGQKHLSLDALIKIQKCDYIEVNDMLIKKGWEFAGSKDENEDYKRISWSFNQDYDVAQAWLSTYTNQYNNKNIVVSYTFSNSKIYNSIINEISAYKMKRIKNQIGNNSISTIYQGKSYTVMIDINSTDDNEKGYVIDICKNADYSQRTNSTDLSIVDAIAAAQADSISNAASIIAEINEENEYQSKYLYRVSAYTNAAIYKEFELVNQIYSIPEDYFVYVIAEKGGVVYVYCNKNYGYMLKAMLKFN